MNKNDILGVVNEENANAFFFIPTFVQVRSVISMVVINSYVKYREGHVPNSVFNSFINSISGSIILKLSQKLIV